MFTNKNYYATPSIYSILAKISGLIYSFALLFFVISCSGGSGQAGDQFERAPQTIGDGDDDGDGIKNSIDPDDDGDLLVEVFTAHDLDNIRYHIAGEVEQNNELPHNCGTAILPAACKGYELMSDISLSGYDNWRPIGYCESFYACPQYFDGIFEGNNHIISDLRISLPPVNGRPAILYDNHNYGVGLFGASSLRSSFRNLRIVNADVNSNLNSVGSLVGHAGVYLPTLDSDIISVQNISIDNSYVSGERDVGGLFGHFRDGHFISLHGSGNNVVGESTSVGGLIGEADDSLAVNLSIRESIIDGSLASSVGGLVGDGDRIDIRNAEAHNNNIRGDEKVGGIVGDGGPSSITVVSVSEMNISGSEFVGGVAGDGRDSSIEAVRIEGTNISGDLLVGGVVGLAGTLSINDAKIIRINVLGDDRLGGVVGTSDAAVISNITVIKSNIIGNDYLGGIAGADEGSGFINATVLDNYINGGNYIGGIWGSGLDGSISWSSAFNNTLNASGAGIGGLVGRMTDASIEYSYAFSDLIRGERSVGGLVGMLAGGSIKSSYSYTNLIDVNLNQTASYPNMPYILAAAGGFVGGMISARIINSYAATDTINSSGSESLFVGSMVGVANDFIGLSYQQSQVNRSYAILESLIMEPSSTYAGVNSLTAESPAIMDSYWNNDTIISPSLPPLSSPNSINKTSMKSPTMATGIYSNWGGSRCISGEDVWDFGTAKSYPALACVAGGLNPQRAVFKR